MKKGLLVGVAVGGLLYVMWRRRQVTEAPPAWQPAPPVPAPAAEEPVRDHEIADELQETPAGAPDAAPAEETFPSAAPVATARHEEPTLHHPGRNLPLTSSGFASKPQLTAFRGSDRPQAAQARISWPGTGGPGAQRPKPLRLVPTRSRPSSLRRSR